MITESNSIENYQEWAAKFGYVHCHYFDFTSSAGDWSFIVSKDGYVWNMMYQENRWPGVGYDRYIETADFVCGTLEEAMEFFAEVLL